MCCVRTLFKMILPLTTLRYKSFEVFSRYLYENVFLKMKEKSLVLLNMYNMNKLK